MQRGRGGHGGERFGKSPRGKGPFQKVKKPDLRPKIVPISKRIRDATRLINKPDVDPAVKAAQEKKLAALTEELEQRKRVALEKKYASRYHKIRFFERVKLERRLAKLGRQQSSGETLSSAEESEIEQLVEDLQYVLNFPKGEKYISILKTAEDPEAQAHLDAERARLRALVQRQLAEAALMGEADEGRSLAAKAKSNTAAKRKHEQAENLREKQQKKRERTSEHGPDGVDGSEDEEEAEEEEQSDLEEEEEDSEEDNEQEEEEEKDDFFLFGSEDEGEEDLPVKTAKGMEFAAHDDDDDDEAPLSNGEDDEVLDGSESDKEEFKNPRSLNKERVAPMRREFHQGDAGGRGDRGRGGGRFGGGSARGGGRGEGGRGRGGRDSGRGRGDGRGSRGRGHGSDSRDNTSDPAPFRGLGGSKPVAKSPSSGTKKPVVASKKAKVEKLPVRKRAEGGRKRRK